MSSLLSLVGKLLETPKVVSELDAHFRTRKTRRIRWPGFPHRPFLRICFFTAFFALIFSLLRVRIQNAKAKWQAVVSVQIWQSVWAYLEGERKSSFVCSIICTWQFERRLCHKDSMCARKDALLLSREVVRWHFGEKFQANRETWSRTTKESHRRSGCGGLLPARFNYPVIAGSKCYWVLLKGGTPSDATFSKNQLFKKQGL